MDSMTVNAALNVATWNTQWATPGADRGSRVAETLESTGADIIVVTEGNRDLLPADGQVLDAGADWGYPLKPGRRKVIIWSRLPLSLETVGTGRIAWPAGRRDCINEGLRGADYRCLYSLAGCACHYRAVRRQRLVGTPALPRPARQSARHPRPFGAHGHRGRLQPEDSRVRQPVRVAERLAEVLAGWTTHTAGDLPNGPHIDHIATDDRLVCRSASDWSGTDAMGRLSDHAGVSCRLDFT